MKSGGKRKGRIRKTKEEKDGDIDDLLDAPWRDPKMV